MGNFDPETGNWFQRLTYFQRVFFLTTVVITGVLLFLGIYNWIHISTFLQFKLAVPVWVILFVLAVMITEFFLFRNFFFSRNSQIQKTGKPYTKDTIFEIDWEWQWHDSVIQNLTPICPQCSNELIIETRDWTYGQKNFRETFVECDNCDFETKSNREEDAILLRVEKEIKRRNRLRYRGEPFSRNRLFKWFSEM